jgi:hypothetical protein
MRRLSVLAALVLLTACGGGSHHQTSAARAAVTAYLARVNSTEAEMQKPLQQVSAATRAFTHPHGASAATTTVALAQAQRTLIDLYTRLLLVTPPKAAKPLHSLLLRLIQRQASLAGELRELSIFNPAFAATLQPLVAANASARTQLLGTKKPAKVVAALEAYRVAIEDVAQALHKLQPPAVERPLFEAQLARLDALGATIGQLQGAVRAHDPTATAKFQHAVSVASVLSDSTARQKAQRNAVIAYDNRVASVQALARQVQREHDRLQSTLP